MLLLQWFDGAFSVKVFSKVDIAKNKLTPDLAGCGFEKMASGMVENVVANTNYIYIYKVIGYK